MAPLTFEEVKARRNRESFKDIPVPEWDGEVRIRRLPFSVRLNVLTRCAEIDKLEKDAEGNIRDVGAAMDAAVDALAVSITDGEGNTPFDNDEGRAFLGCEDPAVLVRLVKEVLAFASAQSTDAIG